MALSLPNVNTSDLLGSANPLNSTGHTTTPPATSLANVDSYTVDGTGQAQQNDLFFRFVNLKAADSILTYPYVMAIVDVSTGKVIGKHTFPISPQNISINVPSATVLEATMKGIYETHNGAPFRYINISGTSGVLPLPPKAPAQSAEGDLQKAVEYAFQNTISAVSSTVTQATKTINAITGGSQSFSGPLNYTAQDLNGVAPPTATSGGSLSNLGGVLSTLGGTLGITSPSGGNKTAVLVTGYETINDLSRLLDYYLAGKKSSANKAWRLYFLMYKDEQYYACSLKDYSITKSAGTLEYQYSINLVAYRREKYPPYGQSISSKNTTSSLNASNTSNILSQIINGITQARSLVAASASILSGITTDLYTTFIAPLNQITLLAKDVYGLGLTAADFTHSISTLQSMSEPIKAYYQANATSNPAIAASLDSAFQSTGGANIPTTSALNSNGQAVPAITTSAQNKLSSGQADYFVDSADSADPFNVVFQNPFQYTAFFDALPINDLNLPVAVTNQLDSMTNQALQMTSNDIANMRDSIVNFGVTVSAALGGASQTWNNLKGLGPVPVNYHQLTVDDIILLSQLNDICLQLDSLISMMDTAENNNSEDYYQFYSSYALTQGLQFNNTNLSRFFVPFPLNGTLEQLSSQYLGTPDRWIEIAALNALKPPYVDNTGYTVPVTAAPGVDTLFVANAGYMYIGQVVSVSSNTVSASLHQIAGIDVVNPTQTILTFVDVPNSPLTSYTVAANATITAYMPNTVNANMLIAIPSASPPTLQTTIRTSPEIQELNAIARIAKIDFLLDSNGDISFTGGGDILLAYGMTNLVQAAMMKLQTNTGQMLQLPSYGNPVSSGMSVADVTADQILDAISNSFKQDPRFNGILAGEVQISGPVTAISVLVGISNTQVFLPVQAQLPK